MGHWNNPGGSGSSLGYNWEGELLFVSLNTLDFQGSLWDFFPKKGTVKQIYTGNSALWVKRAKKMPIAFSKYQAETL